MSKHKNHLVCICIIISILFNLFLPLTECIASQVLESADAAVCDLPSPGTIVRQSETFTPVLLRGITIDPKNPFKFDFIIDNGNSTLTSNEIKKESQRLVNYFLTSITVPKEDLWVNLSPYESDRIIPQALGNTELGRDMLAQDYMLKQLTSSMMYPEDPLGNEFWQRLYTKVEERFGTTTIPIDTFNKVWVIPQSAKIYENGNMAYIVESSLKVMLEEDFFALKNNNEANTTVALDDKSSSASDVSSQVIREILIPEIEREVNEGENFAVLRQLYNSLIIAKWYEVTVKNSLLSEVYTDQNKIVGVDIDDKTIKEKIYQQYVKAYKKGAFDYIKKDYDKSSQKYVPRRYFSGGEIFSQITLDRVEDVDQLISSPIGDNFKLSVMMEAEKSKLSKLETPNNICLIGLSSAGQPHSSVTTALYSLSGSIKQNFDDDVDVTILDMYANHDLSIESIAAKIISEKPKMVGLSLVAGTLPLALELMEILKTSLSVDDMPLLVLGNTIANYIPKTVLTDYFSEALIVQKEGDIAIIEIVEFLMNKRKKEEIHNLIYLENGKLKENKLKAVDIDTVAIDIDEMTKYADDRTVIQIETSRGCPWGNCLFCASRDLLGGRNKNRKWRGRPLVKVIEEIGRLMDKGITYVSFIDEEFIGPGDEGIKRTQEFAREIIKLKKEKKVDFRFHISCRADSFFELSDDNIRASKRVEMLRILKEAGLQKVFLGVESGSQSQLDRYNKGLEVIETEKAFSLLREQKLDFEIGFIMFDPEVAPREIQENMDFIHRNKLLPHMSWFLNELRIQVGTPFEKKYLRMPEAKMSKGPDHNDLQYTYDFLNSDIRELTKLARIMTDDSAKLYYKLKSISRSATDEAKRNKLIPYIKKKDIFVDLYFSSFQDLMDIGSNDSISNKSVQFKSRILESLLRQIKEASALKDHINKSFDREDAVSKEVLLLIDEFIQKANKTIAELIVSWDVQTQETLLTSEPALELTSDLNEIIFILKPGGTYNSEVVSELINRINDSGYSIAGLKIFDGQEIDRLDLFEKEHALAFKIAREGDSMFTELDYEKLKSIYDVPGFSNFYGLSFKETKLLAAYDLIDIYGLTEKEVSDLWIEQYDENTFMKGDFQGINKVGSRKYVAITSHPKVNDGKPFVLINGICIQMKHIVEAKGDKSIIFLLRGNPSDRSKRWKSMREEFLGDKSAAESPNGSIRNDAYMNKVGVTEDVPFWKNIAHLSSGPFESLHGQLLWYSYPIENTYFGKLLLNEGYSHEEVQYFLSDPAIVISGINKPLFDWTEKMDTVEAHKFISKILPAFYSGTAKQTMNFKEFIQSKDTRGDGSFSVFADITNIMKKPDSSVNVDKHSDEADYEDIESLAGLFKLDKKTGKIYYKDRHEAVKFKMPVYAVRHGQSVAQVTAGTEKIMSASEIDHLSEEGQQQALKAAPYLYEQMRVMGVFDDDPTVLTSQLMRAQETMDPFRKYTEESLGRKLTFEQTSAINELDFGIQGYLPADQLSDEMIDYIDKFRDLNGKIKLPKGESYIDLLYRAKEFILYANEHYAGKPLILFTHNLFMSALRTVQGLDEFINLDNSVDWTKFKADNTDLWVFDKDVLENSYDLELIKAKNVVQQTVKEFLEQLSDSPESQLIIDSWKELLEDPESSVIKNIIKVYLESGYKVTNRLIYSIIGLGQDVTDPWGTNYLISDLVSLFGEKLLGENTEELRDLVRDHELRDISLNSKDIYHELVPMSNNMSMSELRQAVKQFKLGQKETVLSKNNYGQIAANIQEMNINFTKQLIPILIAKIWEELNINETESALLYFNDVKTPSSDLDIFYVGPKQDQVDLRLTELCHLLGIKRDLSVVVIINKALEEGIGKNSSAYQCGGNIGVVSINGANFNRFYEDNLKLTNPEGTRMLYQNRLKESLLKWGDDVDKAEFKIEHLKSVYSTVINDLLKLLVLKYDLSYGVYDEKFWTKLEQNFDSQDDFNLLKDLYGLINQTRNLTQYVTERRWAVSNTRVADIIDVLLTQQGVEDYRKYILSSKQKIDDLFKKHLMTSTDVKPDKYLGRADKDWDSIVNSYNQIIESRFDNSNSSSSIGGISMNDIKIDSQRLSSAIQFDPDIIQNLNKHEIDGFKSVIIDLKPITSIMSFLGLAQVNLKEEYNVARTVNN